MFVLDAAALAASGTVVGGVASRRPWWSAVRDLSEPRASQREALRVLGRSTLRAPDSRPNPAAGVAAVDGLPGIDHIVVLMLENHSYDNFLGMLGRDPGERPRGDGFTLAADGYPTASNPYPNGRALRAFRMPTTCQLHGKPSQEWAQSHIQYANGRNDGFVISDSGPVAMGYWTRADLPFTYDLASHFPIGDRWFSSCLAQTDPQRRYLIAATSSGMTDDIGESIGNLIPDASLGVPANGTIFERMTDAGISWADYNTSFPTGATMELYPTPDGAYSETNAKPIGQFFTDAAAGKLPSFSLLDPNFGTQSQENPQNIVVGETFLARTVNALGASPQWHKTLLIVTYDEHGGYYDHVPPPAALPPDSIPPQVQPGESSYDGFARYGFRVPAILVGPYAKPDYVSHVVYDHTSILALVERKWNLAAMTYRDANANDLTDFIDLDALSRGEPTYPDLPKLAPSGENARTDACEKTGPGTIPPPLATRPLPKISLRIRRARVLRHAHTLVLELKTTHGTLHGLHVDVYRGTHRVATERLTRVTAAWRHVRVHLGRRARHGGRYTIVVRQGHRTLLRHTVGRRVRA